MKLLKMTTVGLLMAGTAMAQTATDTTPMDSELFVTSAQPDDMYGTELIGQRLYVAETEFDESYQMTMDAQAEWDDVGEIGDILVTKDGQIEAVLLDIGGFLGLGEKTVAVNMNAINFLVEPDSGDTFIAVSETREGLENAPEFERAEREAAPETEADVATDAAPAEGDGVIAGVRPRPTMSVEGYSDLEPEALTAEKLEGARVYSVNDEDIGEIGDLVLNADGQITEAVVDVGGFLGIGEKAVALGMNEVQIVQDEAGADVRVYVDATKEALESRPEFDK